MFRQFTITSLLLLIISSSSGFAQDNVAAIARKGDKWGMIDKTGNWVIPAEYEEIQNFNDQGKALAKKDDMWGLINKKGEWVLDPKFDRLRDFEAGYAMAELDGNWVVIDESGEVVMEEGDYKRIDWLHDGIIIAYEKKKMIYINVASGEKVPTPVETKKQELEPFSEGLARFEADEKWGFIDKTGQYKIEPQFDDVNHFKDGKSKVRKGDKWGVIDKEGNWLVEPKFEDIHDYQLQLTNDDVELKNNEETALAKMDGLWGIIDNKGNWIIEPKYERLKPLNDGIAIAVLDGKDGWVKEDGTWLAMPEGAEKIWPFFDGYAMVRKNGLMGYVNTDGEFVVEPKYEKAYEWSGPFGRVWLEDVWYYVNTDGDEFPIKNARTLYTFHDGLAAVRLDDGFGYVDETGEIVIPATYTNIEDEFLHGKFSIFKKSGWEKPNRDRNGFIIVRKGDWFGTIDKEGNVIIPIELDDLKAFYPF